MNYSCCDPRRRDVLQGSAFNGIDFLEVLDHDAPSDGERQRTLFVHFINPLVTPIGPTNVRIEGGDRIRDIGVINATVGAGNEAHVLTVDVDKPGDFSTYTLRIVQDQKHNDPPKGFDELFSAVEFSFKVECVSDFDCQPARSCPPDVTTTPEIDYLAKDYATFRRLMLDRMAALVPEWKERNAADLGIALVELLAYVGDKLSYEQDAIATEAYLGSARRRVSVRRHARLVDYFMHDGGNARVWVQVEVTGTDHVVLPQHTALLSRVDQQPGRIEPERVDEALRQRPIVFETIHDALLFEAHTDLSFYTWGDARCCLPTGATRATLVDDNDPAKRPRLRPGDVLMFEERIGPHTGLEADADPTRRHAVRLTRVSPEATSVLDDRGNEVDRTAGPLALDRLPTPHQPIVEIEWAIDDALPFPFCISAITDQEHGRRVLGNVCLAHGNTVLADHGQTIRNEPLGTTGPDRILPVARGGDRCNDREPLTAPARFRPNLRRRPLAHAASFTFPPPSAADAMTWPTDSLAPSIVLNSDLDGDAKRWTARRDLLDSAADSTEFVVETESDGTASIRIGDGEHGLRAKAGTRFTADYRVGNGRAGNIGAGALAHIVSADEAIKAVRNPLPAVGGIEPESMEDVRQRAPNAFRTQERAVTERDYGDVTERDPRVQRASATFRWTGSWHTVFVTVDRFGGLPVDADFKKGIAAHLDAFRMAGHDLEVDAPRFVSLELELHVCAKPDYFRSDVEAAVLESFSNRVLLGGRRGLFHPDNFSFGQRVYLSPLYATAQALPGVASVQIVTFKRQDSSDTSPLDLGFLELNRLEIARLDNDRNFAERGVFRLTVGGGK